MTQTLTTERMAEIAKLAIRLQHISSCAAVTSSGETIMHHTHVDEILSALHDVTSELLANREAQPVDFILGMEVSVDVSTCDADAGHRMFGTVTEISELDGAKNGCILLVQDAEKNFTAPPAPGVPEAISTRQAIVKMESHEPCDSINVAYKFGWNACRAAMLAQPVSQGYKLVPVELTPEMQAAWDSAPNCSDDDTVNMMNAYRAMIAAAPDGGN